jgi:hypothetical protein
MVRLSAIVGLLASLASHVQVSAIPIVGADAVVDAKVRVQGLGTVGAEYAVMSGSSREVLVKDNMVVGGGETWSEVSPFDA